MAVFKPNNYLVAHGLSFFASVLIMLLLPKYLGVAGYASFSVTLALLNFLIPISTFGLGPFIIRHYKTAAYRNFDLGYVAQRIFLVGYAVSIAVAVIGCFVFEDALTDALTVLLALACVLTSAVLVIASSTYRAARDSRSYLTAVGSQRVLMLLLFAAFFAARPGGGGHYYMLSLLLSNMVAMLFASTRYFPANESGKERSAKALSAGLIVCLPIAASNALLLLTPVLERALLNEYLGAQAVSQYVFNADLTAKLVAAALLVLKIAVYPSVMVGEPAKEVLLYKRVLKRISILIAAALFMLFVAAPYLYGPVMSKLLKLPELANFNVFLAMAGYSSLVLVNYVLYIGIMLTGRTHLMISGYVLFIGAHMLGIYFLVPRFGLGAAAMSLVAAQCINTAYCYFANREALIEYSKKTASLEKKDTFDPHGV